MRTLPPGLYAGTTGWVYDTWAGTFYPQGTKSADYLDFYAKTFSAVEVDSTFYRIPQPDTVAAWKAHTPDGFVFTAKFPRVITEEKRLQECQAEVGQFLEVMSGLGAKLGPLVLQFDYTFQADQQTLLENFLGQLPGDKRYAVEVRHRSWLNPSFYDMLRQRGVALVLADRSYMPRLDVTTADWVYIRWLGNRADVKGDLASLAERRAADLAWWAQRVVWRLREGKQVFAFASDFYAGHAPATIQAFADRLDALYRPEK